MTGRVGRLGSIALDCDDPPALAGSWATVLGGEIIIETDGFCGAQLDKLLRA